MQSKIRGIKEPFDPFKWSRWYAWYPCRAMVSPELVWAANKANKADLTPPWRWVWFSYVERKFASDFMGSGHYMKRVTEETR